MNKHYVWGVNFIIEECCNCGIQFAMTEEYKDRKLDDKTTFHCPNGHPQHYVGKSDKDKLRDELDRNRRQLMLERQAAAELRQQRNQLSNSYKRIRDRVKNGVCPCCNRSFPNLLNHMKSQHPEFGNSDILKSVRVSYGLSQAALADEIGISHSYVSKYENAKSMPGYAVNLIEKWVMDNTAKVEG